jgi:hypothetical protein
MVAHHWARLTFATRALACEWLIGWSIKVKPTGYIPSYVQAVIDAGRDCANGQLEDKK